MKDILTVRNLSKKYNNKRALHQITFSLPPGRVTGLMGPNGAGKTTLFKTILQICHPDQGEITICGEKAGANTRKYVSYMPDINHLFNWMNIADAIRYHADMFPDFDCGRADELCDTLHLNLNEKVQTLSHGMRQRVLIMLTFSRKARLFLLDEPIGGIDPIDRDKIIKIILGGLNENNLIIVSTHLIKDIEMVVDDLLFLNEGQLLLADSAENIRSQRNQSVEDCYMEVLGNVKTH
jgi:ABC-2 type transport system ATP-binding protein